MTINARFACLQCQHPITKSLALLPGDQHFSTTDGKPALPAGFYALGDDDLCTGSAELIVVNIADVVGVQYHPNFRRLSGCCGLDGCDGPNLVCTACGGEVGTQKSDCWMPHYVLLLRTVPQEGA